MATPEGAFGAQAGPSTGHVEQQASKCDLNLTHLPDAVLGLIFGNLDNASKVQFMKSCKAIATCPAVLAQIHSLSIGKDEPSSKLRRFPRLAHLKRLHLRDTNPRHVLQRFVNDVRCWEQLRGLQTLDIWLRARYEAQGSDLCCLLVFLCPELEQLRLVWPGCSFAEPGCIPVLSRLQGLKELECGFTALELLHDSMQHLAMLSQLTSLHVEAECRRDAGARLSSGSSLSRPLDVSPLSALRKLQHLKVGLADGHLTGLQALGRGCSNLTSISLDADYIQYEQQEQQEVAGHVQLGQLPWPSLREAVFDRLGTGGLGAMGLQHAQHLEKLYVDCGHLDFSEVSSITSLENLSLVTSMQQGSTLDVSSLSALAQLRKLSLQIRHAELSGMQAVATGCKALSHLKVDAAGIRQHEVLPTQAGRAENSGSGSSHPSCWPALASAELNGGAESGISALGLRHAPSLQKLEVGGRHLDPAEVAQISSLTSFHLFVVEFDSDSDEGSVDGEDEGEEEDEEGDGDGVGAPPAAAPPLALVAAAAAPQGHGLDQPVLLDVSPLTALKQLRELDLQPGPKTRCTGMQAVAQGCTSLRSLTLSAFTLVPDQQQAQGQQEQEQQQLLQQAQGQEQDGREASPWWPALAKADVGHAWHRLSPSQVTALQLHRARRLQQLQLGSLHLKQGNPASDVGAFAEMCRQLAACPTAGLPCEMRLTITWPPPYAPLLSGMGPLASSLTGLCLMHEIERGRGRVELPDARALAAALPRLRSLNLDCNGVTGDALAHLAVHLSQLCDITLWRPCETLIAVISAAQAAQEHLRATGPRANPLTFSFAGPWKQNASRLAVIEKMQEMLREAAQEHMRAAGPWASPLTFYFFGPWKQEDLLLDVIERMQEILGSGQLDPTYIGVH